MITLAIETSCDETSIAVTENRKVLSVSTKTHVEHEKFGGVVPEIASRMHIELINVLAKDALAKANITVKDIDVVGVTNAPGLLGSLIVGVLYAKGVAQSLNIPLVGVNHIYSHIQANFIENSLELPYIGLVVSGGHTQLIYTEDNLHFKLIGTTRDDAAGEAFDKGAKILGLGYPGGPIIDNLTKDIDSSEYNFPIAMKVKNNFDFSFSGLKTNLLYFVKNRGDLTLSDKKSIAFAFQKAIVDALIYKLKNSVKKFGVKNIVIAGGVSGNSYLRKELQNNFKNLNISMPSLQYCTDNAAMVGVATYMCRDIWQNSWNRDYTIESISRLSLDMICS